MPNVQGSCSDGVAVTPAGAGVITWRNEMAVGEGSWFLIEEYPMVPQ
jgi:hypothetical protein